MNFTTSTSAATCDHGEERGALDSEAPSPCSALMEVETETRSHLSHLHRHREGSHPQKGGQLVPVTRTRILCSSLMSFLQPLLFLLRHLVHIIPLTQKPHAHVDCSANSTSQAASPAFPSNNKGLPNYSAAFDFPSLR